MVRFGQGCTQGMVAKNNKTRVYALGLCVLVASLTLSACGGSSETPAAPTVQAMSDAAVAGEALFNDKSLSASGQQSCGTCHVKSRAFTADPAVDKGLPVPLGGVNMDEPGFRNAPSLMYAAFTPPFSLEDGAASGGFFRDGRASSLATQAIVPFVTPFEMANQDAAEVVSRLKNSPDTLRLYMKAFATDSFSDPNQTLLNMGAAIGAYETEDVEEFEPFTSKFDAYVDGKVKLTDREMNGLALFNNPGKGNCTACHPSVHQEFSSRALFTDFSYDNIGIPRNWNIPANSADTLNPITSVPLKYMPAPVNVPNGRRVHVLRHGYLRPLRF